MSKVLDLPLSVFFGSKSFKDRVRSVSVWAHLSPIEKMRDCLVRGLSCYEAMAECRVSYGAMVSFKSAYDSLFATLDDDSQRHLEEFNNRYEYRYFAFPEDFGLVHNVYYYDKKEKIYVECAEIDKLKRKLGLN